MNLIITLRISSKKLLFIYLIINILWQLLKLTNYSYQYYFTKNNTIYIYLHKKNW